MRDKKGEMGVGTLVVFIAMLLVAGIAAGVVLTTADVLQQKSLATGQEAKGEISTKLSFVQIVGRDGSDGTVENLSFTIRLAAGSEPIFLNDTLLSLGLADRENSYRYANNSNISSPQNRSLYYDVRYLVRGTEFRPYFLSRGDVAELLVILPRSVGSDEDLHIKMVPKIGSASHTLIRLPTSVNRQDQVLYP